MLAESACTHALGFARLALLPCNIPDSCFPQPEIKGGSRLPRNFHGEYQRSLGCLLGSGLCVCVGGGGVCVFLRLCVARANFPALDLRGFESLLTLLASPASAGAGFGKVKLLPDKFARPFLPHSAPQCKVRAQAAAYRGPGVGMLERGGGGRILMSMYEKWDQYRAPSPLEGSQKSRDSLLLLLLLIFLGRGWEAVNTGRGVGGIRCQEEKPCKMQPKIAALQLAQTTFRIF